MHRTLLIFTVTMILAVLAFAFYAMHLVQQEQARRRIAEQRVAQTYTFVHEMLYTIHDDIRKLPGSGSARHLMAARAVALLDIWAQDAASDPVHALEVAKGYQRLSNLLNNPSITDFRFAAAAFSAYEKQRAVLESAVRQHPQDAALRQQLAAVLITMAMQGRQPLAKKLPWLDQAETHLKAFTPLPGDELFAVRKVLARLAWARGYLRCRTAEEPAAAAHFDRAIALYHEMLRTKPNDADTKNNLAFTEQRCPTA